MSNQTLKTHNYLCFLIIRFRKINSLIANQEIIILVTEKNDEFSFGKVKYTSSYTFKTININDIKENLNH